MANVFANMANKYAENATNNPSLFDKFDRIVALLEQMVVQTGILQQTMSKLSDKLDQPMRISTWGSTHITLTDTSDVLVPNSAQVVGFTAWVEGSALAAGISLIFDDSATTPTFTSTITGPIANPRKVRLTASPSAAIHVIFLTSNLGGWEAK